MYINPLVTSFSTIPTSTFNSFDDSYPHQHIFNIPKWSSPTSLLSSPSLPPSRLANAWTAVPSILALPKGAVVPWRATSEMAMTARQAPSQSIWATSGVAAPTPDAGLIAIAPEAAPQVSHCHSRIHYQTYHTLIETRTRWGGSRGNKRYRFPRIKEIYTNEEFLSGG